MIYFLLLFTLFASQVQAASLYWDSPTTGTLTVELGATATGPFAVIATIPASPARYVLTPGRWGFYRLVDRGAASNVVRYSADLSSPDITDRLDDLEARLTALEAPPLPMPNLSATPIDADHLEILGGNCVSLKTTGSGLRRIVECVH